MPFSRFGQGDFVQARKSGKLENPSNKVIWGVWSFPTCWFAGVLMDWVSCLSDNLSGWIINLTKITQLCRYSSFVPQFHPLPYRTDSRSRCCVTVCVFHQNCNTPPGIKGLKSNKHQWVNYSLVDTGYWMNGDEWWKCQTKVMRNRFIVCCPCCGQLELLYA